MEKTFRRKATAMESFFMDLDDGGCNMTIRFFLQLDRQPALALLDDAMQSMLRSHPSVNLKYQNRVWRISREVAPCRVIEADTEDVYNAATTKLDFRRQTLALNVIHTKNDSWFLRFEFFHGAMDARSGIQFIYDFFATLNGKQTEAAEFSLRDRDLIPRRYSRCKLAPIPSWPKCSLKDGKPTGREEEKTVMLRTEAVATSMAARLAGAVGQCFQGRAPMVIPVDVRRFSTEQKNLYGNLFVPIIVDANSDRPIEQLRSEISAKARKKQHLSAILNSIGFYRAVPERLRKFAVRHMVHGLGMYPQFVCCALVSPLGRLEEERLQAEAFRVVDAAAICDAFPVCAFTVGAVQYGEHTNTTIAWNTGRVPRETVEKLMHTIDHTIGR